jgi:hypothetical protein
VNTTLAYFTLACWVVRSWRLLLAWCAPPPGLTTQLDQIMCCPCTVEDQTLCCALASNMHPHLPVSPITLCGSTIRQGNSIFLKPDGCRCSCAKQERKAGLAWPVRDSRGRESANRIEPTFSLPSVSIACFFGRSKCLDNCFVLQDPTSTISNAASIIS